MFAVPKIIFSWKFIFEKRVKDYFLQEFNVTNLFFNKVYGYSCRPLQTTFMWYVARFRKREKHLWRSVTLVNCRLKLVTLLKVTLLRGCLSPWSYNALVLY